MLKVRSAFCIQRHLTIVNKKCIQTRTVSSLLISNENRLVLRNLNPVFDPPKRHNSTFSSMYLKMIDLPAVHWIEDSLCQLHSVTGLPWWALIIACTATARLVLTGPAHVTAQKVAAKRLLLAKEMEEVQIPSIKKATDRQVLLNKWNKEKAKKGFDRVARLTYEKKVVEYNCHHAKLYVPFYIQIPLWVFISIGLRNMSTMRVVSEGRLSEIPIEDRFLQFSTEGFGWISNLTVPDPTFVLPVAVGLVFASNVYISSNRHANASPEKMSKFSKGLIIFLYLLSAMMIPIAAMQPSAVALYWASSGAAGLVVNLVLMSPRLRRLVRIPKIPSEPQKPYTVVKENIQKQINRLIYKQ